MDDERVNIEQEAEACLLSGKELLNSDSPLDRRTGVSLILRAYRLGNIDATCYVAKFILDGLVEVGGQDSEEYALYLLYKAEKKGSTTAKVMLYDYCTDRYNSSVDNTNNGYKGELVDFDGKKIKIDRTGLLTPIDAELKYENGENMLILSANIHFAYVDEMRERKKFEEAVVSGIKEWEGEYRVFGNQKLKVILNLTFDNRRFDNVYIVPVDYTLREGMEMSAKLAPGGDRKASVQSIVDYRRSFAVTGLSKWSAHSRKIIYLFAENFNDRDFDRIKHTTKHEFGHALGLGDLYEEKTDKLAGVEKGTYAELDGYYITDKIYNLVMCDHNGPISNNDIEMVVLAFRDNEGQHYQKKGKRGKISKALGKGN